jgi:hypothetical protein
MAMDSAGGNSASTTSIAVLFFRVTSSRMLASRGSLNSTRLRRGVRSSIGGDEAHPIRLPTPECGVRH